MISDGVSLADKLRRLMPTLVPKEAALDTFLTIRAELSRSPNKDGIAGVGAQDDVLTWADDLVALGLAIPT